MIYFVPQYYNSFVCKADKCKHNCCLGWEICIDSDSADMYKYLSEHPTDKCENILDRLRNGIEYGEEPCFKQENGRCVFLNENNLCDLILALGEGALCEVCAMHPRFVNYYSDRVEAGIGLCCEEAARLALLSGNSRLAVLKEDDENACPAQDNQKQLFEIRDKLFNLLRDRDYNISANEQPFLSLCGANKISLDFSEISEIFLSLEVLNEAWRDTVKNAKSKACSEYGGLPINRFAEYLTLRHFINLSEEYSVKKAAEFIVICVRLLKHLAGKDCTAEEFCDLARRFSEEVEYSDCNIGEIINRI